MNKPLSTILNLFTLIVFAISAHAQKIKMSEVMMISDPGLKPDVSPETLKDFLSEEIKPAWKPVVNLHLFRADRGDKKGEFLLVCPANKISDREALPSGSPFKTGTSTEYRLLGPGKFKSLPVAGIFGIHYLQVKPDRAVEFEKFVAEKLNPAVGQLLPDLQLLYYKAVAGENAGTYITIFAIESVGTRDKYWPAGAPETETIKQAFRPFKDLAAELGSYLVEDSYLKPESGGAAAFFESRKWTDFVHQGVSK